MNKDKKDHKDHEMTEEDMLLVLNKLKKDHVQMIQELIDAWRKDDYCGYQLRDILFTYYIQMNAYFVSWIMTGTDENDPNNVAELHLFKIFEYTCRELGIHVEFEKCRNTMNIH